MTADRAPAEGPAAAPPVRAANPWLSRLGRLAVVGAFAGTALGQTAALWWPGELAVHWTLHALPVLVGGAVLLRRRRLGALAMAGAVLAAWPWVAASFAPRAPVPAAQSARLRVVHANLYLHNPRPASAVLAGREADLLALVEVGADDREALAGDARWPHQAWALRREADGTELGAALLSRHPVVWWQRHDLPGDCAIEAELLVGGRPLRVVVAHPKSPTSPRTLALRDADLVRLAAIAAAAPGPLLAVGDWNCTVASPRWRAFLAAARLRAGDGPSPATWPAPLGPFGIGIDRALAGGGVALGPASAFAVPGSDHRGIAFDAAF